MTVRMFKVNMNKTFFLLLAALAVIIVLAACRMYGIADENGEALPGSFAAEPRSRYGPGLIAGLDRARNIDGETGTGQRPPKSCNKK
ncbi:MAG: hypothetical protein LBL31_03320 [Spirochaetaceae bacterium]|jgi:hypothetical protein|nr:hypothetical protein [Spirochaetaceae bacterium]